MQTNENYNIDCCVVLPPDFDIKLHKIDMKEVTLLGYDLGAAVGKLQYIGGWNYGKSIGLEFRHILMYFSWIQSQRFSESQIFFIFSTLRIYFCNSFCYQPYLSKFVYHMPKKLRKSMKSKAFMTKIKISAKYFGTDFSPFTKLIPNSPVSLEHTCSE